MSTQNHTHTNSYIYLVSTNNLSWIQAWKQLQHEYNQLLRVDELISYDILASQGKCKVQSDKVRHFQQNYAVKLLLLSQLYVGGSSY